MYMAIIKCKMCGGDLTITEDVSVAECEYCGTKQTVPNTDNEKKLALFGRANRLRLANEFDKAAGVYESIVAEFPEEAEAYWGLVLCRYGIEYVDDPASGKKIPTCHRSSFDSVLEDSDFEQACENADVAARKVYRDEAKAIEALRRDILEVSGKEEPYDIFICYKETDDKGERTIDSVIAQDVYNALTEKGFRVFFSRISLEDKLGTAYEPYIFAALNSAKVMLAFGTDFEYFNAVWVRNEWSRFLALIAAGQKKTLIPCYKGIDAYDLPREFAKLQAQDMGKVGAIQDLLRGVEKVLGRGQDAAPKKETIVQQIVSGPTAENLLQRGRLLLEDKNWNEAQSYFNKVLDINAEFADAYVGLLCVRAHAQSQDSIGTLYAQEFIREAKVCVPRGTNISIPILTETPDYKKAMRYGSPELQSFLKAQNITFEKIVGDYVLPARDRAQEQCNRLSEQQTQKKQAELNAEKELKHHNAEKASCQEQRDAWAVRLRQSYGSRKAISWIICIFAFIFIIFTDAQTVGVAILVIWLLIFFIWRSVSNSQASAATRQLNIMDNSAEQNIKNSEAQLSAIQKECESISQQQKDQSAQLSVLNACAKKLTTLPDPKKAEKAPSNENQQKEN